MGHNRIGMIGGTWNFYFTILCENSEVLYSFTFYIGGYYTFFLGVPKHVKIPENIKDSFVRRTTNIYYLEVPENVWDNLVGDFFSHLNSTERMIELSITYEKIRDIALRYTMINNIPNIAQEIHQRFRLLRACRK